MHCHLELAMALPEDQKSLINPNASLQSYYTSLESRIGYHLVLGGTRHFGYYPKDTYWPFPLTPSLRAMEDHLFSTLSLPPNAHVLDAGCGVAHVALHLASQGLRIQGIDVVDHHIEKARRNVAAAGQGERVKLQKGDYHHLECFPANTFDGAYTMETFVHATDPDEALRQFYRVLKPGGVLAHYEYDHNNMAAAPRRVQENMKTINRYASMPSNARFNQGVLEKMLEDAGFVDVVVRDLTVNVTPMLRLFFVLAFVPFLIVRFLGLEKYFVNTVAGVEGYRSRKYCRYVAVSARKPEGGAREVETEGKTRRR